MAHLEEIKRFDSARELIARQRPSDRHRSVDGGDPNDDWIRTEANAPRPIIPVAIAVAARSESTAPRRIERGRDLDAGAVVSRNPAHRAVRCSRARQLALPLRAGQRHRNRTVRGFDVEVSRAAARRRSARSGPGRDVPLTSWRPMGPLLARAIEGAAHPVQPDRTVDRRAR